MPISSGELSVQRTDAPLVSLPDAADLWEEHKNWENNVCDTMNWQRDEGCADSDAAGVFQLAGTGNIEHHLCIMILGKLL